MALHRGIEGPDPAGRPSPERLPARLEKRPATVGLLAIGTLACPSCDAPVAPAPGGMSPSDPMGCGFCDATGAVRDFLSLTAPSRPARVEVRVVRRIAAV